jgi:Holliday junction resolvase RusA-like endonuclease
VQIAVASGVPPSWSKKKRSAALNNAVRPTGKPDIDNLIKTIGDALNGIMWRDDSQIVMLQARKFYATEPFTVLTVEAL